MQALFSFSPEKFCILLCLLQILTTRYGTGGKSFEKFFPEPISRASRVTYGSERAAPLSRASRRGRRHATVSALRPWRYWTRELPKSYVNRWGAMSRSRSTRSSGARTPSAAPAAFSRARSARSLPWSRRRAFLLSVWGIRILRRTPSGRLRRRVRSRHAPFENTASGRVRGVSPCERFPYRRSRHDRHRKRGARPRRCIARPAGSCDRRRRAFGARGGAALPRGAGNRCGHRPRLRCRQRAQRPHGGDARRSGRRRRGADGRGCAHALRRSLRRGDRSPGGYGSFSSRRGISTPACATAPGLSATRSISRCTTRSPSRTSTCSSPDVSRETSGRAFLTKNQCFT